jgi:iron complex outermembrane receptor protein
MRKTSTKCACLAGAALAIAMGPPAIAQTAEPELAANAGDIIVTARRSEERLQDVPISITVLNAQDITNRNIYNAVDLGSYVPSLAVDNKFGPEKASFAIRGFTQETKTAPSVGVYFADVIAPRGNSGTGGGNGAGVGSFMDLQNVQVLKGPQGTLFGRNTTGGAILLVPSKPTDKLEGWFEETLGDYNLRREQAVLNVPLSDSFRVRAAIDENQRDGYLHNRSGIGPSRLANTNYFAGRLSIVGDLTPNLENYTIATFSRSHTYGNTARVTLCNPAPSFFSTLACGQIARQNAQGNGFWDVENSVAHPQELLEQWQVINTTTWKTTDTLTIKNIASYGEFRERADFSLSGDDFQLGGAFFIPYVQISTPPDGYAEAESTVTEELQFQGRTGNNRLNWQAGAYLEISKPLSFAETRGTILLNCSNPSAFQCFSPLGPTTGSISAANQKDSFNNKGIYAQGTYKLLDQLSVTAGIRYTIDRAYTIAESESITFPAPNTPVARCLNSLQFGTGIVTSQAQCHQNFELKSQKPTWLVDLDYKPIHDMLFYGKWSRGYRAGSINPNNAGLEISQPETVDTYEVGNKTSFRGPIPGYIDVAGFYNNFRNQQLAVNATPLPAYVGILGGAQPIVNAGKSRIWGIEVDSSISPFTGLKLDAGYTYLNTRLLQFTVPTSPLYNITPTSTVGSPLGLSPKNRYTVSAHYTLPLAPSIGRISFGATFNHTDSNLATSPVVSPLYLLAPSNLLDVDARWNSVMGTRFDLSFFMTNVTNQKLILFPTTTYYTLDFEGGHLNEPRMFGFRLRHTFSR